LDTELIRVALRTKLDLNVSDKDDVYGKRVHRDLAVKLGIPYEIAYRKKEAAQHGSGIHEALNLIAKNNGYDISKVSEAYLDKLKGREKIGSSQRYGYNYCEQSLWGSLPHVQLFLDEMAGSYRRAIEIHNVRS
jgi:asparagine synthase (glutamine-hydrolysing)